MTEQHISEIADARADLPVDVQEEDSFEEEAYEANSEDDDSDEEGGDDFYEAAPKNIIPQDVDPLRMLEAILFASASPLSPQAILERLPEGSDLNVLLPELKNAYEGRGVELVEIGGQWALRTAKDVGEALIVEKEVSKKMSKAALETMAIIAYHQPITRAEIENIRGVATHRGTLDILMEMGWVKPGRRRETPGRPLTWMTTATFLDHFQLESIMDLPGLDDLKASGLLDRRAAIETLPDTGDLFDSGDVDAEEVLDQSDEDAYDEASYKEMKAAQQNIAKAVASFDDDDFDDDDEDEDQDQGEEE